MSSRNAYLSAEERKQALVLHRSLERVQQLVDGGERDALRLIAAGREEFAQESAVRLDYFEVVDPDTLDPVSGCIDGGFGGGGGVCRSNAAHRQCSVGVGLKSDNLRRRWCGLARENLVNRQKLHDRVKCLERLGK